MSAPKPTSRNVFPALCLLATLFLTAVASAGDRRKIIIDQDCSGPGGSNMQTLLVLIQSPEVEVLGITVVSGNQWRDVEVARTLRLLEIVGRTDIPVVPGAVFPLVRNYEETLLWQQRYGKPAWGGAWDSRFYHEPFAIPDLAEGRPSTKALTEDAAHFLIRMVRQYPNEVTIYEGGPMTNLALAISIDPDFPRLAKELVFMGGSLSPRTDDAEFVNNPRHEFNFWFDPEAAQIVLRAPWKKLVCTPTDISIKTRLSQEMVKEIESAGTPLTRYIARFYTPGPGADYMWDELAAAAWIDPSIITKRETRYMGVDLDRGAGYGNTLTWDKQDKARFSAGPVEVQVDLDYDRFRRMFVELMTTPTPMAQRTASSVSLEKTYWKLTELGGNKITAASKHQEAHLIFDPESKRVSGSGGCNRIAGNYQLNGDRLQLGQMAGTMMACAEGMDTEKAFLESLQRVVAWRVVDRHLELLDGDGKLIARFEAAPSKRPKD